MVTKKKVLALLVAIYASYVLITMGSDVRLKVESTKTTFYVFDGSRWDVTAIEYNKLYNGTKLVAKNTASPVYVRTNIDDVAKTVTITRKTVYKNSVQIIDTYFFDGKNNDVKLFPIYHKIEIINGSGLIYQYEVDGLPYSGPSVIMPDSPQHFGKGMSVTWQPGYYYSLLDSSGNLTIKYKVNSSYEAYDVRVFDPPTGISLYMNGYETDSSYELGTIATLRANVTPTGSTSVNQSGNALSWAEISRQEKTHISYINGTAPWLENNTAGFIENNNMTTQSNVTVEINTGGINSLLMHYSMWFDDSTHKNFGDFNFTIHIYNFSSGAWVYVSYVDFTANNCNILNVNITITSDLRNSTTSMSRFRIGYVNQDPDEGAAQTSTATTCDGVSIVLGHFFKILKFQFTYDATYPVCLDIIHQGMSWINASCYNGTVEYNWTTQAMKGVFSDGSTEKNITLGEQSNQTFWLKFHKYDLINGVWFNITGSSVQKNYSVIPSGAALVDDSIYALWHFDEGTGNWTYDSSSNRYALKVNINTNYPCRWTSANKKFGSYAIDCTYSSANLTASVAYYDIGIADGAVTAWSKSTDDTSVIYFHYNVTSYIELETVDGKAVCTIRNGTGTGEIPVKLNGTTIVNNSIWHYFVCSWGSGGFKLYVDGNLDASTTWGGFYNVTGGTVVIGGDDFIDEVRLVKNIQSPSNVRIYVNTTIEKVFSGILNSVAASATTFNNSLSTDNVSFNPGIQYRFIRLPKAAIVKSAIMNVSGQLNEYPVININYTPTGTFSISGVGACQYHILAQTFKPAYNFTLKNMYIYGYRNGVISNVTLNITGIDASFDPNMSDVKASCVIDNTTISTSAAWHNCTVSDDVELGAGINYALIVHINSTPFGPYLNVGYKSGNPYTAGGILIGYPGCSTPWQHAYENSLDMVSIIITAGYPQNPFIDVGSSGKPDEWNWTGNFTPDNGTQQVNLNATIINNYLRACTAVNGFCNVPIAIASYTVGKIPVEYINVAYELNMTMDVGPMLLYLNGSAVGDVLIPFNISSETDGIVTLFSLNESYYGSDNVTISAHANGISKNRTLSIYYSNYGIQYPARTTELVFIPNSNTTTNTTPFGQSNSTPGINISKLATRNFNIAIRTNVSLTGCYNLTFSNSTILGIMKLNTTYQKLGTVSSWLGSWWGLNTLNCPRSTLYKFYLYMKACCVGCVAVGDCSWNA
jgi:hypothetical protein